MGSWKFDLVQLLLLGLPLLLLWKKDRFQLQFESPESLPDTAEFKPYLLLFGLITAHIMVVWLEALTR